MTLLILIKITIVPKNSLQYFFIVCLDLVELSLDIFFIISLVITIVKCDKYSELKILKIIHENVKGR